MGVKNEQPPALDQAAIDLSSWLTGCKRIYHALKDATRNGGTFDKVTVTPINALTEPLRSSFNRAAPVILANREILERSGVLERKVKMFDLERWSVHIAAVDLVRLILAAVGWRKDAERWEELMMSIVAVERYFFVATGRENVDDAVAWMFDKITAERVALGRIGVLRATANGAIPFVTPKPIFASGVIYSTPFGATPEKQDAPSLPPDPADGAPIWKGAQPLEARLLKFMWDRERATIDDVEHHVWDGDEAPHNGLRGALSRANRTLLDSGCGRQLHQKQGEVYWEFPAPTQAH